MLRRDFIRISSAMTGLGLLGEACGLRSGAAVIPGEIVGASAAVGHMLRDGSVPGQPAEVRSVKVAIVGGGVSGLSAARWLKRHGVDDLLVLDLEHHMGGNASYGHNKYSAYPWGAHYIPVPNNDLQEYLAFLEDAGVITGHDDKGLPVYNEYHLCFDPQERLYINGVWQDGLVPRQSLPEKDQQQIARFMQEMEVFRQAVGADGKQAFAIPVDASSQDPLYLRLDGMTMTAWLKEREFDSLYLSWYINYCTRDDFGTSSSEISAWAGIHYFAARKGKAANADRYDVLTWPEGNGWLVQQLSRDLGPVLQPDALVTKVFFREGEWPCLRYYDTVRRQVVEVHAEHVVLSTPQFVNSRLLDDAGRAKLVAAELGYTPWMVANLTVTEMEERGGQPLSWDNVLYDSPSLGYVEATHQQVGQLKERRVLTYYLPLTDGDVVSARKEAAARTHADWVRMIVDDLRKVHPDIDRRLERVDVMVWGHAMARPVPGWIHGAARRRLGTSSGRIHFAHTDLAGISIFEEGFYQGIGAAKKILNHV